MTQTDRLQKYLREHPGATIAEITFGLQPFVANPRARISDLRKQLEPQGLTVIGVKRKDGVMGFHIRPTELTLGFGDAA